jgi:hypothetical protein
MLKGTWSEDKTISVSRSSCFVCFFFARRYRLRRTELERPSVDRLRIHLSLRQMSSLEGGEATGEVECKTKGFHRDEYRRGRSLRRLLCRKVIARPAMARRTPTSPEQSISTGISVPWSWTPSRTYHLLQRKLRARFGNPGTCGTNGAGRGECCGSGPSDISPGNGGRRWLVLSRCLDFSSRAG